MAIAVEVGKIRFADVLNTAAMGADQMMMRFAVGLDAE